MNQTKPPKSSRLTGAQAKKMRRQATTAQAKRAPQPAAPAGEPSVWRQLGSSAARGVGRDVGAVARLFGRLSLDGLHHAWKRRLRPSRTTAAMERDQLAAWGLLAAAVAFPVAVISFGPLAAGVGYGAAYVATSAARRRAEAKTVDKKTGVSQGPVKVRNYTQHRPGVGRVSVRRYGRSEARG